MLIGYETDIIDTVLQLFIHNDAMILEWVTIIFASLASILL